MINALTIVWIYRSERYKFEDWRLAFEVDIKIDEHEVLEGVSTSWSSSFQDSFAYKHYGRISDLVLKHIYLDLQSKLSYFFL